MDHLSICSSHSFLPVAVSLLDAFLVCLSLQLLWDSADVKVRVLPAIGTTGTVWVGFVCGSCFLSFLFYLLFISLYISL